MYLPDTWIVSCKQRQMYKIRGSQTNVRVVSELRKRIFSDMSALVLTKLFVTTLTHHFPVYLAFCHIGIAHYTASAVRGQAPERSEGQGRIRPDPPGDTPRQAAPRPSGRRPERRADHGNDHREPHARRGDRPDPRRGAGRAKRARRKRRGAGTGANGERGEGAATGARKGGTPRQALHL